MTPKQEKIVEAAIKLIAEKGYHNTSTSEIAKQAGVAEGTIFRHYKTKKDLLVAIVTPVMMQSSVPIFADKLVDQVFQQSYEHFEDLLYTFMENRLEFAKSNVALIKIFVQELAFHPDLQTNYKKVFTEKVYPFIDQALHVYQEKGEVQNLPTETIIRLMIPTILGFIVTRLIIQPDKNWDDEAEIKRTVDYIMNGIGTVDR